MTSAAGTCSRASASSFGVSGPYRITTTIMTTAARNPVRKNEKMSHNETRIRSIMALHSPGRHNAPHQPRAAHASVIALYPYRVGCMRLLGLFIQTLASAQELAAHARALCAAVSREIQTPSRNQDSRSADLLPASPADSAGSPPRAHPRARSERIWVQLMDVVVTSPRSRYLTRSRRHPSLHWLSQQTLAYRPTRPSRPGQHSP